MSIENLVQLLQHAATDEKLNQQLQDTSSYEEIKNLARQESLDLGDLSEKEARRAILLATGAIAEASDEELEKVAGGAAVWTDMRPLSRRAYDLSPNDLSGKIRLGNDSAIVDWLGSLE